MPRKRSPDRLWFLRIDHRAIFARKQFVRALVLLAGVWMVYTFLLSDYSITEYWLLSSSNASISAKMEGAEAELDSLEQLIVALEDDPEAIEQIARERYHMVGKDELAYVFIDVPESEKRKALESPPRRKENRHAP